MPAVVVQGRTIVVTGGLIKLAAVRDEDWIPGQVVADPARFVPELRAAKTGADILTFAQKLPDTTAKYAYPLEWENVAAIRTNDFQHWWEEKLPQETRKNVRRSGRRGVVVRPAAFDDALIHGLKLIYDEAPIRQGRRFWHYGKDLETIRRENSSYLDTCEWLGAYHNDELIGVLKMVYVGDVANVMQFVSKLAHADKRPMNALIAQAVEVCSKKGINWFVYGQYVYGNNSGGQLTEFKRRNGFEQIDLPRYYIPLTAWGRLAIKAGVHRGWRYLLPAALERQLIQWRTKYYERRRPEPNPV